MLIKFKEIKSPLSLKKVENLHKIEITDYFNDARDKVAHNHGAHLICVIMGRFDEYVGIDDFLMHVLSIQYANYNHFQLPDSFADKEYLLNPMSFEDFNNHISAYFEGFFEYLFPLKRNLNLWKIDLNIEGFIEGYRVETLGTAQILICSTSDYYLYFVNQSIN